LALNWAYRFLSSPILSKAPGIGLSRKI